MKNLATLILCMFWIPVCGQVVHKLTLQESIEMAIDSSLQSFRVKNLYFASYWQYRTFRAARLPALNLTTTPLQYNREFIKRYDPDSNIDVYRVQQSFYSSANVSLNQNLDLTGGTFFVDSELGFFRNFGQTTFSQYSSIPIRVGYAQSLLGFNKFKWEKRIEPLKYEKAKRQFLYAREEISEAVIQLFFGLLMAKTEFDMAEDNVGSADTLFYIGQERFHIASISQADMLTLKLDALNARNTLKNIAVDLKKASFELLSYLNMKEDARIEIVLPERPQQMLIPIEKALQLARQNSPDYLAHRQEVWEAEREVERTSREASFNANLSATAGFNQVGMDLNRAYRNPLQQNIVSLGIQIPILDWGVRRGRVNMAKNNLNVAKISVQQREQALAQEIIVTISDFEVQQDMISSAEEALSIAIDAYQATRQRFIIGKSDINSLTLSLNRQKEAHKNYILALKNYWSSYYKIRKLTLYDFENQATLSYLFDQMHDVH